MNGHAPWFAGSSCTQTTCASGKRASSAAQLLGGQRVELLDRQDRDVVAVLLRRAAARS